MSTYQHPLLKVDAGRCTITSTRQSTLIVSHTDQYYHPQYDAHQYVNANILAGIIPEATKGLLASTLVEANTNILASTISGC
jgi:hypothetical protein